MSLNTTTEPTQLQPSAAPAAAEAAPKKPAGPPWLDPSRQQEVTWRDGDVVISVPIKSGTNWMMNIVHQLLAGGSGDFDSIYDVVAWPEFVERPGQPASEVAARYDAMPTDQRRAFKTHTPPGPLPYAPPGVGRDVKYVVVCRNPEEALVSFKTFLEKHTDAFFDLWGVPKQALTRPDFPSFYRDVIDAKGMQGMLFGFLASWWPHRHASNVLMLHFADLKRDLPGATRKVASFLGIEPTAEQWARIDEHTTFAWMKQNEGKFSNISKAPVKVLEDGSMVRKGAVGAAREDGMTDEIAKHLREVGSHICTDADALEWLYEGGALK
jgi:hypothetical protein